MTVLEQELRKLFDYDAIMFDTRFVGNACYGSLTDSIRAKIQFTTGAVSNQYDGLKITLLNRQEGEIDSLRLRFLDLWGMKQTANPNFKEGVAPHLWDDYGKISWYVYHPNKTDYRQLADAVKTYLEVFQEPVQGRQIGQNMC